MRAGISEWLSNEEASQQAEAAQAAENLKDYYENRDEELSQESEIAYDEAMRESEAAADEYEKQGLD